MIFKFRFRLFKMHFQQQTSQNSTSRKWYIISRNISFPLETMCYFFYAGRIWEVCPAVLYKQVSLIYTRVNIQIPQVALLEYIPPPWSIRPWRHRRREPCHQWPYRALRSARGTTVDPRWQSGSSSGSCSGGILAYRPENEILLFKKLQQYISHHFLSTL